MKVRCIKKPDKAYLKRAVTVGKNYEVVIQSEYDYLLIDDNNEDWYYPKRHFTETTIDVV